jgi:hypothetical protein
MQTFTTGGTAAIAFAVHKSLFPLRFPLTVAITPVVHGMNRENSLLFRVVGGIVDKVPFLVWFR